MVMNGHFHEERKRGVVDVDVEDGGERKRRGRRKRRRNEKNKKNKK
jgi:hypothetical protein